MKTYFCYIMASKEYGTLYIGVTNDLLRRVYQHKTSATESFTEKHQVHRLVWFEQYNDINQAILREKQLKKWERAWKYRLIRESNPAWEDLYETIAV